MLTGSAANLAAMKTSAGIALSAVVVLALSGCGSQTPAAAPTTPAHHSVGRVDQPGSGR